MSQYKQAAELRAVFPLTFACIRPHNSRCMLETIFYITFSFAFNVGTTTKEALAMRGYFTASGFYGLVDGRYMLFACEAEYYEYLENEGEDS